MDWKSITTNPVTWLCLLVSTVGFLADYQDARTTVTQLWPFLSAIAPIVALGASTAFLCLFFKYSFQSMQRRRRRADRLEREFKQRETELACNIAEDLRRKFDICRNTGYSYFEVIEDEEEREHTLLIMQRLDEMGLGPPQGSHVGQWHAHLGKLLPHIRIYGVDHARQERDKWYK